MSEATTASQSAVDAAPTFFVDGHIGIATANGVARVSFVDTVFNVEPGATLPRVRPVVTLVIPENSLAAFAQEITNRAENIGSKEK